MIKIIQTKREVMTEDRVRFAKLVCIRDTNFKFDGDFGITMECSDILDERPWDFNTCGVRPEAFFLRRFVSVCGSRRRARWHAIDVGDNY